MPVGTKGTVKTVDPDELRALGTSILLSLVLTLVLNLALRIKK